jgi:hypothetical protein
VIDLSERMNQVWNDLYGDGFWTAEGLLSRMTSLEALVEKLENCVVEMERYGADVEETLAEYRDHCASIEDRINENFGS